MVLKIIKLNEKKNFRYLILKIDKFEYFLRFLYWVFLIKNVNVGNIIIYFFEYIIWYYN